MGDEDDEDRDEATAGCGREAVAVRSTHRGKKVAARPAERQGRSRRRHAAARGPAQQALFSLTLQQPTFRFRVGDGDRLFDRAEGEPELFDRGRATAQVVSADLRVFEFVRWWLGSWSPERRC